MKVTDPDNPLSIPAIEPSLWSKSSWRGEQSVEKLCKDAQSDLGDYLGSVSLYIVYGSWNRPTKSKQVPDTQQDYGLQHFVDGLLHEQARLDTKYTTGRLQVDADEEAMKACCGDDDAHEDADDTNNEKKNGRIRLPCPPESLPALLLVLRRASMKTPEIQYVEGIAPKDLLLHWKHAQSPLPVDKSIRSNVHNILESFGLLLRDPTPSQPTAVRLFVAGDRMSVGKTSVCLGLIGSLIRAGYPPESLAYIKPATQNEKPQLVQHYCDRLGVACVSVGPIVYYRGFTRAFLAGQTETTEELLDKVEEAVDAIAKGKQVVLIDGVGFPAVGSICGTDNASVARASGYPSDSNRRPPGVVLVGGPGVGSAVDAFNLNATYFERANVPVLGAIFNKLSLEGFYSLENCKEQITSYFGQNENQQSLGRRPFGFVPLYPGISGDKAMEQVHDYIRVFEAHVDVEGLIEAAAKVQDHSYYPEDMEVDAEMADVSTTDAVVSRPKKRTKKALGKRTTREEIETAAIQAGAAPSA